MADGQLGEHPADHLVQVAAGGQVREELLVLAPDGRPVGPVHVRVVEEVAVDPPGLVQDLLPLLPGLDADLDGVHVQDLGLPATRAGPVTGRTAAATATTAAAATTG